MINNRQNGRRRGRGGQRAGGNPGRPDNGSRIDNRARGNASQLHEKYKALAAEAQRQGDRVNTEYYLQFADHYFRVLNENRSRFEEQQRPRRDEFEDEFDGGEGEEYGAEGEPVRADQYQPQPQDRQRQDERPRRDERPRYEDRPRQDARAPRDERDADRPREDRRPRNGNGAGQANGGAYPRGVVEPELTADFLTPPDPVTEEASTARAADMEPSPRRRGRPRRDRTDESAAPEGFEAERLPPSLSVSASAEPDADEPADKPRRRRRAAAPVEAPPAG